MDQSGSQLLAEDGPTGNLLYGHTYTGNFLELLVLNERIW